MPILNVEHVTTYAYHRAVGFGPHRVLFRPRGSHDQTLLLAALKVTPEPASIRWVHDVFGNSVAIVSFAGEARELRFESHVRLEHTPDAGPDFELDVEAATWPFAYAESESPDLAPVIRRHVEDADDRVGAFARRFVSQRSDTPVGRLLMTMTAGIKEQFTYLRRPDPGTQSPLVTLERGQGTCRDFAWLMIEALRSLGFAARFVTGYLYVPSRDAPDRRGGGATHAWCQIYLPGAGWVDFDPTNAIVGNRDLIRVGVAREPQQAKPLSGRFIGKAEDYAGMHVEVSVYKDVEKAELAVSSR